MPVVKTAWSVGNRQWLGSNHALENAQTGTLDLSTFTAATHFPEGYIKSGMPLNVANLKAIKPWTAAAGEKLGFLTSDQPVQAGISADQEDFTVAFIWHGRIKTSFLPIAFTVPTDANSVGKYDFTPGV